MQSSHQLKTAHCRGRREGRIGLLRQVRGGGGGAGNCVMLTTKSG